MHNAVTGNIKGVTNNYSHKCYALSQKLGSVQRLPIPHRDKLGPVMWCYVFNWPLFAPERAWLVSIRCSILSDRQAEPGAKFPLRELSLITSWASPHADGRQDSKFFMSIQHHWWVGRMRLKGGGMALSNHHGVRLSTLSGIEIRQQVSKGILL